jgi:hypothetical protein
MEKLNPWVETTRSGNVLKPPKIVGKSGQPRQCIKENGGHLNIKNTENSHKPRLKITGLTVKVIPPSIREGAYPQGLE